MDKIKNIALYLGIAVVVLILGVTFPRSSKIGSEIIDRVSSELGALVGPDIPYNYLRVGGLLKKYQHFSMSTATSTLCVSDKTTATSTVRVSGVLTASTGTPVTITMEDTTIPFATPTGAATSTLRGEGVLVAADTLGSFAHYATSSQTLAESNDRNGVIGPNKYVVIRGDGNAIINAAAGAGKGQVYGGTCNFEFTEL